MADRRRLVRISPVDGSVTVVRDLETGANYRSVASSFTVTPGARKTIMSTSHRRYGGGYAASEQHDNGTIAWKVLVNGATADTALANAAAMLTDLESPASGLLLEWRPDGATYSTYYELRGPAHWTPTYEWAQFAGVRSMVIDIALPVGPLAFHDQITVSIASTTLPAQIALGTTIPGDAPALADITLTHSGGSAAPIWALIGWSKRPGTPLSGSVAPFGVIEAETGTSLIGWASTADANARGGNVLQITTSGAGTARAVFSVDPSVMLADAFTDETLVEVWARIKITSTVVSPRLILSSTSTSGVSFGWQQYSNEFGTYGKTITVPGSGTVYRFVRLGTLTLPVDAVQPLKRSVIVDGSWAAGSAGAFGIDYLVMVPARQRAASVSGKPNDDHFPDFIASTASTTKTIRSDLSGRVAAASSNPSPDSGLGGSMIELPPGNCDLVVKLSSLAADDPTIDSTTEQLSHTVTGSVRVIPRTWLARSS
jgi:hypothetical protein